MAYTLQQLQQMGATPITEPSGSTSGTSGSYTLDQLQKLGATPIETSAPQSSLGSSIFTNNPITRFVQNRGNELAQKLTTKTQPKTYAEAKSPTRQDLEGVAGIALGVNPAGIGEEITQRFQPLAKRLEQGASDEVGRIFNPTTKPLKQLTQRISPKFQEEAPKFFTLKGLLSKAEENIKNFGTQIGEKFDSLSPETREPLAPILQRITKAQDQLLVKGTNKVPSVNQAEHQALSSFKNELVDLFSNTQEVPSESLHSYLQNLDSAIEKAKKGFGYSPLDSAGLAAQKTTANIIRDQMATNHPDIAAINKEFTFWKNVEKIAKETKLRKTGQVGGIRGVITGAGLAEVGAKVGSFFGPGGAIVGAGIGGFAGNSLQKIFDSAGYARISMVVKHKAAGLLASGKGEQALKLLQDNLPRLRGVAQQVSQNSTQD